MRQSMLRFFADRRVAMIGDSVEVRRAAQLVSKWDGASHEVEDFMDDGLTFESHCMSLYIQNDRQAWTEMEQLFAKTKEQGKTSKSNWRKAEYFRRGFSQIMKRHSSRLCEYERQQDKEENRQYLERFRYDGYELCNWWINYYFAQHDAEMQWKPLESYTVSEDYSEMITNAKTLEKKCKGITNPPDLVPLVECSEIETHIDTRGKVYVSFEWADMNHGEACHLMGAFKSGGWTSRDGTYYDHTEPLRKKLNKAFPHCSFQIMDTPSNLYGDNNNWFYIYFKWKPEHFSWAQIKKAAKWCQKHVRSRIKQPFRAYGVDPKYSVVTLVM
jgi:hypothetical protein